MRKRRHDTSMMMGDAREAEIAMSSEQIRAAVIDDHPLYRLGLRTLLASDPRLDVAVDVGSPDEALSYARHQSLELALVDLVLPGMTGVSLVARLHQMQPSC